jgi:hypothetical protein
MPLNEMRIFNLCDGKLPIVLSTRQALWAALKLQQRQHLTLPKEPSSYFKDRKNKS